MRVRKFIATSLAVTMIVSSAVALSSSIETIGIGGIVVNAASDTVQIRLDNAPLGKTLEFDALVVGMELPIEAGTISGGAYKTSSNVKWTVSNSSVIKISNGTLTIKGTGACKITATIGSASTSVNVTVKGVADSFDIAYVPAQEYTGSAICPKPVVKAFGKTLTLGKDYTLSYNNNKEIGLAHLYVNGKGDFSGAHKTVNFNIVGRNLGTTCEITSIANYKSEVVYTGKPITFGTVKIRDKGKNKELVANKDYKVVYENNTAAITKRPDGVLVFRYGIATIKVMGIGAYGGSLSRTFKIVPCDISKAENNVVFEYSKRVAYNGKEQKPKITMKRNGMTLSDSSFTASYSDNTKIGTATINVKGEYNYTGSKKLTFEICKYAEPAGIALNKTSATLSSQNKLNLSYTFKDSNGKTIAAKDIAKNGVTWTSSNTKVAKVSNGVVTPVSEGNCTITVKTQNGETDECDVDVEIDAASISVNSTYTIYKGLERKLTAKTTPAKLTNGDLKWVSTNTKVVKVDSEGVITGVSNGTANVVVSTPNGKKATCKVTVVTPAYGLKLDKTSLSLEKGKKYTLKANYTNSDISSTERGMTWSTSNSKVATVSSAGVVTAVGNGTCNITVKSKNGKTATCKVTVKSPIQSVKLTKTSMTLKIGKSYTLRGTISPSDVFDSKLTWTTSNTKIATVDKNGKVVAKAAGSCNINVRTANGKTATCKVTVTK